MASTTTTPAAAPPRNDKARLEEILKTFPMTAQLMQVHIALEREEQLRHQLFLRLAMALVAHFWNGNTNGPTGEYPQRRKQQTGEIVKNGKPVTNLYGDGKQYFGHNIAAVAVDGDHHVIDFDFNHNDLFKSSIEHAEARLMRRLFNLTGLRSEWSLGDEPDLTPDDRYMTKLSDVTIYTTLEPCAQCAGIMALARVKEVVYLQPDPGAFGVANILYNLKPYDAAARPITAVHCGMDHGERLDAGFEAFRQLLQGPGGDFFHKNGAVDRKVRLTRFLCTDKARSVFVEGADELLVAMGEKAPTPEIQKKLKEGKLKDFFDYVKNIEVEMVGAFLEYAIRGGHRGTPH